jgi:acetyl-CoA carboxylase biotin carboxyl carrier protein
MSDDLIGLIDKLEALLNESEISELEIEAGETALVLRKPVAFTSAAGSVAVAPAASQQTASPPPPAAPAPTNDGPPQNAVLAPLTGLFYSSPSPGAQPYTSVGAQITQGQVIGLIEAMKLFNEIKSDRAGKVVRMCVDDGALVKAKQPLIEVE